MTLCMVNTFRYFRGGDSAYALRLEEGLTARGWEVQPFAMHHPRSLPHAATAYYAEEVDYPALQAQGGLGAAAKVVTTSIYNRQARKALARLLDERPCRLAHLHSVMHHLTAAVVHEFYARDIPVVWTLHDLKSVCPTTLFLREGRICEECKGGRFYNALRHRCKRGSLAASAVVTAELYLHRMWKTYERAALIVAPSRFLRDKVLEAGLRPNRIEVLPNFLDVTGIEPSVVDDGFVLFVGRLSREKGIATLIEACVRARIPLHIAGDGELESDLRQLAAASDFDGVHFHGHCGPEELARLYAGARLVAVPSETQENCPLVVLEAFARAKPVVASRLGGLVEMLDGHGVGELVAAGDVDAWVEALARWHADPSSCAESGRRAREVVETDYAPEAHLDQIEAWYAELGVRCA